MHMARYSPAGGKLSVNQQKVYSFILEHTQSGISPSVREICEFMGYRSTSSAQAALDGLERKGCITRDAMHKRSVRIVGQDTPPTLVPLVGTVTAGLPILAIEEIEGYVPFGGRVTSDRALFALRVRGESMINVGILDGDIVFIERGASAHNGEIVVAMVEDEATVKRFFRENGGYRLQPENDAFMPIFSDEVTILGKVVGLTRYF
jgi:repressor LexA